MTTIVATEAKNKDAFNYFHNDFEDALQIASAVEGEADCIINNNKSGFPKSPLPVISPEECLRQLSN